MKQQFLNDSGLTELIGYIKKYVKDEQDVKPYASLSVFPKTGEQNIIYIDTTVNASYYWDDTSNTYKPLDVQTWANLTGKPSTFPPEDHNHDDRYFTETEMNSKLAGKANSSHTHKKADITDFPTSMPASDVPAWAKASTKPTYTKAEVGLGNVDNTADKNKSVKYATSAGSAGTASSVDWSGVKNPPTTYAPSAHTHGSGDITSLSADKITGVIGIDHLPAGALERCKIVADDTARFKLTKNDIQNGDTVKVGTDANAKMYLVIDDTKLSSEAGYTIYTAGSATSVPWSGVTGKPSTFTPSAHTHDDRYYTESEINSKLDGKSNTGHTHDDRYYTESEMNTKLAGKSDASHSHDLNTMINTLAEGTSTPTDNDYYIAQYAGGGTTTTTYTRRLHSALWSYIKGKSDSVYQAKGNYAASSHTHTIAQISNLQTILDSKAAASHTHTIAQVSGLQSALDGKAASVHTHSYAGSASAGGSANSAVKLDTTSAGSASQPVYFSGGKPVACSSSLGVSITGTATGLLDASGGGNTIKAGWNGSGLSSDKIHSLAAYSNSSGTILIKDAPKDAVKAWLGSMPASDVYAWAKASSKPSYSWGEITGKPGSFTPSSHTHNYAGSSSAGGAATSANKLNTNAGNHVNPVYFSDGIPVACTYSISANVPFDAKFTDTNTWRPCVNNLTSDSTDQSLSAAQGKILKDKLDKLVPIGYIFIWNNRKLTNFNETLSGAPALTSAQAVHDYFGFGTWQQVSDTFLYGNPNSQGGASTVSLGVGNMPSHTHSIPALSGWAANNGAHAHNVRAKYTNNCATKSGGSARANGGGNNTSDWRFGDTDSQGVHGHNVSTNASTTGSNGSGSAFSIMPPYKGIYIWQRIA